MKTVLEVCGSLQMNRGYSYCLVMRDESQRELLLKELLRYPCVGMVSREGALLSNLTAQENIELPLSYHQTNSARLTGYLPVHQCGLIDRCGLDMLQRKYPEQMSVYEKRLTGFMRAMSLEPELMIFDGIYDGLSRKEFERVARFDEVFHLFFPFRTSVLLSFENLIHPSGQHPRIIEMEAGVDE